MGCVLNMQPSIPCSDEIKDIEATKVYDMYWNRAFANASTVAAFKTDGTMWMWGFGNTGQLGNNKSHPSSASEMQSSPIQVGSETTWNVAAVSQAGGDNVSGAIKTDGTLWVWGWNQNGDLGVNDLVWRSSPTQIPGTNWAQLSMSSGNSMATKTDTTWSLEGVASSQPNGAWAMAKKKS